MNSLRIFAATATTLVLLGLSNTQAVTIIVDGDGGGDFLTIQEGIAAASDGDSVLAAPGIYRESIDFRDKGIVVKSIEGPETTIIDGEDWSAEVVILAAIENGNTALCDFTIQKGMIGVYIFGGFGTPLISGNIIKDNNNAILALGTMSMSPRICNNQIVENHGDWSTLNFYFSTPFMANNLIADNWSSSHEGTICLWYIPTSGGDSATTRSDTEYVGALVNNIISNNGFRDAVCVWAGDEFYKLYFINNLIYSNAENGMIIGYNTISMNNTVILNGQTGISSGGGRDGLIINNIIACNDRYGLKNSSLHKFNDVWNNGIADYYQCSPGPGDISEDPLFKDPDNENFHLMPDSPCIDAGTPTFINFDFDMDRRPSGEGFDMGADEWISPFGPHVRPVELPAK